jgi:hypothetical protein
MADPGYLRKLRAITRADPTFAHVEALEQELYASPSDRSAVVMFGSFIETHLERYLASKMRDALNSDDRQRLFDGNGVAATFSSKIILAYAFKLIGSITRHDLDLIRHLRNDFAHSRMPISFETPEVRAVCDQLQIVDCGGVTIPNGYLQRIDRGRYAQLSDIKHPKTRFITTCHSISYRMLVAKGGLREGDFAFPNDDPLP